MKSSISQAYEQRLLLSPEMRQSLTILQLDCAALVAYLNEQATANPVILVDTPLESVRCSKKSKNGDADWIDPAALLVAAPQSVFERLKTDFACISPSDSVTRAGRLLIDRLDENGYLHRDVLRQAVTEAGNREVLKKAFFLLRTLEPAGVGARDLRDCLLLQLKRQGLAGGDAWRIVADHLPLFARNQLPALAKETGIPIRRVLAASVIIRALHPKPLAVESAPAAVPAIPDFSVFRNGVSLEIELNLLPERCMQIDESYRELASDAETGAYLQAQFASAAWIARCIKQRTRTLSLCAKALVAAQSRFFLDGPAARIPYTRRQVAQSVGMHESTITRACKDKYFSCDFGTFTVDYLFPQPVSKGADAALQSEALACIRRIIEGERPASPLSDAAIAEMLKANGVCVSRRTVAKYREQAGIPASSMRRKYPGG